MTPSTPAAGLCAGCRHARRVASKKAHYLRCDRSDDDPSFARYPRLPVLVCPGFEPGGRATSDARGPRR